MSDAVVDIATELDADPAPGTLTRGQAVLETLMILVMFFVVHGELPPSANEAHYLSKARHYWNPEWCPQDHFLNTADAHLVFYWSMGWLTQWLSLPAVAWCGRLVAWTLLAVGWFRLSRALLPRAGVAFLTAAWYVALVRHTHLAGEWVVGGIEAKGIAYGFVFLGLESVVRNRWRWAWVYLGVASAFHVLVGGWTTLAVGVCWLSHPADRESLRGMLPFLALGGAVALAGLWPAVALTQGISPGDVAQANEIYVYQRLPHHLVVSSFSAKRCVRHALLLGYWIALLVVNRGLGREGWRRLQTIVLVAAAIGGLGVMIDLVFPRDVALGTSLLRYYWFRLSDALLPVGVIFAVAWWIKTWSAGRARQTGYLVSLLIVIVTGIVATDGMRRYADRRPAGDRQSLPRFQGNVRLTYQVYQDWVRVCRWIREETPVDAIFVTPRRQQTFKWYAHRAEVVSWKDIPQDAEGVLEWYQRFQQWYWPSSVESGFASVEPAYLEAQMKRYGARYLVRPNVGDARTLPLRRVYPPPAQQSYYEVYERLP